MSLSRKLNLALAASLLAVGATLSTAQVSEAAPATIPCAYGHTCGVDDSGNRYDFTRRAHAPAEPITHIAGIVDLDEIAESAKCSCSAGDDNPN